MTILGSARVSAIALLTAFAATNAFAADAIPPKPVGYFNDYAGVVSKEVAGQLNEQLAQFERETSNQIVVAIYPKMQSDSDVADYTQRVAQSWGVGGKAQNNGAVLFVFAQDRKMFIQVGYGLEGALPDATAFDITEFRIKPHFRSNDYEGGLREGIESIEKAVKGEYTGTGKTLAERGSSSSPITGLLPFIIFVIILIVITRATRRLGGYGYSRGGGPIFFPMGGGGGGGWSSGGGGGFSGFSGGGGSFGGGGAGSSW